MAAIKRVPKGKQGYSVSEVDQLLAIARDQYNQPGAKVLDWRDLTKHAFSLEKGGYEPQAVDSAIDKLQDTFASRELSVRFQNLDSLNRLIRGRLARAAKKRFDRSGLFGFGYSVREVEALLKIVDGYLAGDETLEVDEVRGLEFRVVRGGYSEAQVDAFIDRLVELLQEKRFAKPVVAAPIVSYDTGHGYGYGYPAEPIDPAY